MKKTEYDDEAEEDQSLDQNGNPPPRPPFTVKLEYITPDMAAQYVVQGENGNRRLSRRTVGLIAAAMRIGAWKNNGESIVTDSNNKLIDGQHRLCAVAESNRGQWFVVVRGVPAEVIDTIDSGRMRTDTDRLQLSGTTNSRIIAPALNFLYRLEKNQGAERSLRSPETIVHRFQNDYPDLPDFLVTFESDKCPVSESVATVANYLIKKAKGIGDDQRLSFINELITGQGDFLPPSPMPELLRFLEAEKRRAHPARQYRALLGILAAWNAKVRERTFRASRVDFETRFNDFTICKSKY